MSRPFTFSGAGIGVLAATLLSPTLTYSQTTSQAGAQPVPPPSPWTFTARDVLRVENWHYFEPKPGGGDPDYAFVGNRLLFEARYNVPKVEVRLSGQWVGLFNLPPNSLGPGALGTGPLYYAQGGNRENPQRVYPKYLYVRLKQLAPGLDVQLGRQAYASGAEASSRLPKIEAVKRQRLDARLVGEFEWSIYQRSFDGIRVEWAGPHVKVTGAALMPTQGGFAREAEKTMTDVQVYGATLNLLPSESLRNTEIQAFVWRYDDSRAVTGRPDNTGRSAPNGADVHVNTFGGAILGAYPIGTGQADVLAWLAAQNGTWYDHDHGAVSFATEAGYQWTQARWTPWLRVGFDHASGDDDSTDGEHGTFFPMLPTMRRYSMTTANSTMNLDDFFMLGVIRPTPALNLRIDWHRLWLADAADRWYAGSGATLSAGGNFGYVSRPSNGSTDFGTSFELSAAYTFNKYWSLNGFAGRIWGGPVVTGTFAGDSLWFVYVENVIALSR